MAAYNKEYVTPWMPWDVTVLSTILVQPAQMIQKLKVYSFI